MDFPDRIKAFASRVPNLIGHLQTEAATSTTLVMPFIQALGYDVFNPREVVPEFTADVGTKKGEKVDYAIMRDDVPIMLFEVKCWNANLDEAHASQLYRYFSVTHARFGILTNGLEYRFFSDLDEQNKMDSKPFLTVDMRALRDQDVDALKQFTNDRFQLDEVIIAASELKYTNGIQRVLADELAAPSEEFVRLLAKRVYSGRLTEATKKQFTDIVKRAFQQFINARINERLESALKKQDQEEPAQAQNGPDGELPPGVVAVDGEIVTTQDEVEGFNIVKAIMAEVTNPERVFMRDTKSYCGVLLDDNNRKPICRLRLNSPRKLYLGVFDAEKNEEKIPIETVNDIYKHADRLKAVMVFYEKQPQEV